MIKGGDACVRVLLNFETLSQLKGCVMARAFFPNSKRGIFSFVLRQICLQFQISLTRATELGTPHGCQLGQRREVKLKSQNIKSVCHLNLF